MQSTGRTLGMDCTFDILVSFLFCNFYILYMKLPLEKNVETNIHLMWKFMFCIISIMWMEDLLTNFWRESEDVSLHFPVLLSYQIAL